MAIGADESFCGFEFDAWATCVTNNAIACGNDSDCAGIGNDDTGIGDDDGGDVCDELEEFCVLYTCCDECKTEGLAIVKCAADITNCTTTDCSGAASMMSGIGLFFTTGAFAILSSLAIIVDF